MEKFKKAPEKQLENFSNIFMQLGLVLVLFIVFVSLEYKTETDKEAAKTVYDPVDEPAVLAFTKIPVLVKKQEVKVEPVKAKPKVNTLDEIKVIDNNEDPKKEVIIDPTDEVKVKDNFLDNVKTVDEPDDIDVSDDPNPVAMNFVQKAPVFKGCEGLSERAARACFDKKMAKLVQRHFNADLANDLGLSSGKKRMFAEFVIGKDGSVIDVNVRAPHPRLEKEANRVIHKVPKFQPGIQNDKPVKVKYTLPITFMVE